MNFKKDKKIIISTIMALLFTTVFFVPKAKAAKLKRQSGNTRIETAIEVAKSFSSTENIILVNGWGYADAVSATPLAKQLKCPILLTKNARKIENNVIKTIKDLKVKNVYIIGGKGVISSEIEKDLDKDYKVYRIYGNTRFDTNAAVAKEVLKLSGSKKALLVNGQDGYADALSVASIAAKLGYPVLFSKRTEVPKVIKDISKNLDILAVGGNVVLPENVVKTVEGTKITEPEDSKDRFSTNLAVLDYFNDDIDFENMYVAAGGSTSTQFADALVASAAAAKIGAPVILSGVGANQKSVQNANKFIQKNMKKNSDVIIIGAKGVVSDSIEKQIENIVEKIDEDFEVVDIY